MFTLYSEIKLNLFRISALIIDFFFSWQFYNFVVVVISYSS